MNAPESHDAECADDRDALIDRVAGAMWDSRRVDAADPAWKDVSPFWREHFLQLGEVAVRTMER